MIPSVFISKAGDDLVASISLRALERDAERGRLDYLMALLDDFIARAQGFMDGMGLTLEEVWESDLISPIGAALFVTSSVIHDSKITSDCESIWSMLKEQRDAGGGSKALMDMKEVIDSWNLKA